LPLTKHDLDRLGWDCVDVVLVTGDAYVDHPSFGTAIIGRVLENLGLRVAILAQPAWQSCNDWKRFGRPRLFFGISSGNVDSMINRYTANKKMRSDDQYSPGGRGGLRPDRAVTVYAQRAREAFPGVAVVIGGIEASMRRLAHYDYWSETVRRSVLLDSKADILVYGMGEKPMTEIALRLQKGESVKDIKDVRGTVYAASARPEIADAIDLPSYEEIKSDPLKFNKATVETLNQTNPLNARVLIQKHDERYVVENPPILPLSPAELDAVYNLPFARRPHPFYKDKIPAFEMIKESITAHRGCFGGCSFCSLTLHQGRIIQCRTEDSVLAEVAKVAAAPSFNGIITDIGGPSANMYGLFCKNPAAQKACRRLSCMFPNLCPNMSTDHTRYMKLLSRAAETRGVKKILVNSGIRMDLAVKCPQFIHKLATEHTGGQLSIAPEHTVPSVLALMFKPAAEVWLEFEKLFKKASLSKGKEQYLVPYFISSFPGSDLKAMTELALFLKKHNYRPRQINDFIPAPMEYATAAYYTGLDPASGKKIHVAKGETERRLQRALLQYFKPENRALVMRALKMAGRSDAARILFSR